MGARDVSGSPGIRPQALTFLNPCETLTFDPEFPFSETNDQMRALDVLQHGRGLPGYASLPLPPHLEEELSNYYDWIGNWSLCPGPPDLAGPGIHGGRD